MSPAETAAARVLADEARARADAATPGPWIRIGSFSADSCVESTDERRSAVSRRNAAVR